MKMDSQAKVKVTQADFSLTTWFNAGTGGGGQCFGCGRRLCV